MRGDLYEKPHSKNKETAGFPQMDMLWEITFRYTY